METWSPWRSKKITFDCGSNQIYQYHTKRCLVSFSCFTESLWSSGCFYEYFLLLINNRVCAKNRNVEKVSPAEVGFVFRVMFDPFCHNHRENHHPVRPCLGYVPRAFLKRPCSRRGWDCLVSPWKGGIRRYGMDYLVVANLSKMLGGGFKYVYFHPYLGKISNLTNIFQMGWNHQLEWCVNGLLGGSSQSINS